MKIFFLAFTFCLQQFFLLKTHKSRIFFGKGIAQEGRAIFHVKVTMFFWLFHFLFIEDKLNFMVICKNKIFMTFLIILVTDKVTINNEFCEILSNLKHNQLYNVFILIKTLSKYAIIKQ